MNCTHGGQDAKNQSQWISDNSVGHLRSQGAPPSGTGCHITIERLPLVSDAKDWAASPKRAPSFPELYAGPAGFDFAGPRSRKRLCQVPSAIV